LLILGNWEKKPAKNSTLKPKTNSMNTSTGIRVCLDTNVFISAFIFSGNPAKIFDLAVDKKIIAVTSPAITAEVGRVLAQKFEWNEYDIKKQLKVISEVCELITPQKRIRFIKYQPDNRIVECAVEGKADYIVTGDKKHLLPLKEFKDIPIITPGKFLKIYSKNHP